MWCRMFLDFEDKKLLKDLAALRLLLMDGERDIGLADLSGPKRDVYYALLLMQQKLDGAVISGKLLEHELTSTIPRATFFRALKALYDDGLIVRCSETKKAFRISE
jgi:hypothetical protein